MFPSPVVEPCDEEAEDALEALHPVQQGGEQRAIVLGAVSRAGARHCPEYVRIEPISRGGHTPPFRIMR